MDGLLFIIIKRAHGLNKYLKNCIKCSDFLKRREFFWPTEKILAH